MQEPIDTFFYKSLIMNIAQGILSSQGPDHKFVDQPNKKKEVQIVDETFKIANEFMKRFKEMDEMGSRPD